jgi:hypothetical protein
MAISTNIAMFSHFELMFESFSPSPSSPRHEFSLLIILTNCMELKSSLEAPSRLTTPRISKAFVEH